jgi:hypothetical protein
VPTVVEQLRWLAGDMSDVTRSPAKRAHVSRGAMAENGVLEPGGRGAFGRRLLLAVDAQGYGRADAPTQREFQEAIRRLLDEAADTARLDRARWQTQEAGDSLFAVLPEGVSEPALVDTFMRTLDAGLRSFNRNRVRWAWLRLRAAVHFGPASSGANGFVGRAPVEVGRILESAALRTALAEAPDACLAVGVSKTIFEDVVREAYTPVREELFRRMRIEVKEHRGEVWIWVPGGGGPPPGAGLGPAREGDAPAAAAAPSARQRWDGADVYDQWAQGPGTGIQAPGSTVTVSPGATEADALEEDNGREERAADDEGDVHNTIEGGRQRTVVMGRDFHGPMSFH